MSSKTLDDGQQQQRMTQLQSHIRLSNEETGTAVRDIYNWEDEMRTKDAELRGVKTSVSGTGNGPKKKCRKSLRARVHEPKADVQEPRIKGTDYNRWEKFSKNLANEIDKTGDTDEAVVYCSSECDCGSSDYVDKTEVQVKQNQQSIPVQQQKNAQAAALEKDKGNAYFAKSKYPEAINCYTNGLALDPANTVLYANRAQALLKIQKFVAAEQDCTKALALDSDFTKAYYRRGLARLELGMFAEAKADFIALLQRDPKNVDCQNKLRATLQVLALTNTETGECKEMLNYPEVLRNDDDDEPVDVAVKLINAKTKENVTHVPESPQKQAAAKFPGFGPPPPLKSPLSSSTATAASKILESGEVETEKISTVSSDSSGPSTPGEEQLEKLPVSVQHAEQSVKSVSFGSQPEQVEASEIPGDTAKNPPLSFKSRDGPVPPPKPYFDRDRLKRPANIQEWVSTIRKFDGNVELIQFYCRQVMHNEPPGHLYQEMGTGLDFDLLLKLVTTYEQLVDADEKMDCYKHLCGLQTASRVRALCHGLGADARERFARVFARLLDDDDWIKTSTLPSSPPPFSSKKKNESDEQRKDPGVGPFNVRAERPERVRRMLEEIAHGFFLQDVLSEKFGVKI